jgi:protein-disulfide isomerase
MTKEVSKRQQRRDQVRKSEMRSRLFTIGLVTIGAILIAFVFIYPNLKPAAEVTMPDPVTRPAGDGLVLGDPKAPVKIEVFEDFQCPACKNFTEQVEPRILKELVETGKAYYVFRNYAFIDTNPSGESRQAASASLCANDQGKFWEYHDVLFANWNGENQGSFNDRRLADFAKALNLDMKAFQACFDDGRYQAELQTSFEEGNAMGVKGTPSVFVNGKIVNPGFIPSFEEIAAAVEAAKP